MRLKKICSRRSAVRPQLGQRRPLPPQARARSSTALAWPGPSRAARRGCASRSCRSTGAEPQAEVVGVETGDVEQLGDEPSQPVGVRLDRLDHESLLLIGEAVPAPEQAAREAGHRRQGRTQLVGDRRQDGRLLAFGAQASLRVAQAEQDPLDALVPPPRRMCRAVTRTSRAVGPDEQPLAVAGAPCRPRDRRLERFHQSRPYLSASGSTSRAGRPISSSVVHVEDAASLLVDETDDAVPGDDDEPIGSSSPSA